MNLKDDPRAYAIMGCAMRVHRTLGFGFLESAYGDALEIEFRAATIPTEEMFRQKAVVTCFRRELFVPTFS